jgi:hypothetical protein
MERLKATEVYTENGVDRLNTPTAFRQDASYPLFMYVDRLDANSNNSEFNSTTYDSSKAKDELSSFVGIRGLTARTKISL